MFFLYLINIQNGEGDNLGGRHFSYSCCRKTISWFLLLFWVFVVLLIVLAFNTISTVNIVYNY